MQNIQSSLIRQRVKQMQYKEYRFLVFSDLYRITRKKTAMSFVKELILGESYKYIFWMRTCAYSKRNRLLKYSLYPLSKLILRYLRHRLGIAIPPETEIGSGFYIGHFGGIVVNGASRIGKNCNLSHGVTLGQANRGRNAGSPILGDNIYIGPGAKIVGAVTIGNNVAIGANCVVTRDIPDNSVVIGIPGRIISQDGAAGYIDNTDYDDWSERQLQE